MLLSSLWTLDLSWQYGVLLLLSAVGSLFLTFQYLNVLTSPPYVVATAGANAAIADPSPCTCESTDRARHRATASSSVGRRLTTTAMACEEGGDDAIPASSHPPIPRMTTSARHPRPSSSSSSTMMRRRHSRRHRFRLRLRGRRRLAWTSTRRCRCRLCLTVKLARM